MFLSIVNNCEHEQHVAGKLVNVCMCACFSASKFALFKVKLTKFELFAFTHTHKQTYFNSNVLRLLFFPCQTWFAYQKCSRFAEEENLLFALLEWNAHRTYRLTIEFLKEKEYCENVNKFSFRTGWKSYASPVLWMLNAVSIDL